ncbi:fumarylacetoacetate hydrolase family protein [Neobacillus niacini]|uniref:2-keto-4-pentenoate hydratase n=1 Tax=Neobacillus niacini TaxID=86668 RepID=UPI002FFE785B
MSSEVTSRADQAFHHLLKAETSKISVKPLTELYPNLSIDEAYEIQLKVIEMNVKNGSQVIGKKIGLTSVAMQQLLGVNQPDYGHLLDNMSVPNKGIISLEQLFQPKVEGEIAFILRKNLKGPNVTKEDVLEATQYIIPALEIVDSRITDWKIKLQDTIADNASCGLFVLGDNKFSLNGIDLMEIEMSLFKNGELMNTGKGTDVLGHPATCVAWLANKLSEYDVTLKAGEVILSGALSAAIEAKADDFFTAEFSHLGSVEVSFK